MECHSDITMHGQPDISRKEEGCWYKLVRLAGGTSLLPKRSMKVKRQEIIATA